MAVFRASTPSLVNESIIKKTRAMVAIPMYSPSLMAMELNKKPPSEMKRDHNVRPKNIAAMKGACLCFAPRRNRKVIVKAKRLIANDEK